MAGETRNPSWGCRGYAIPPSVTQVYYYHRHIEPIKLELIVKIEDNTEKKIDAKANKGKKS